MARIVFVTDSASDLDPGIAQAAGIRIVPLVGDVRRGHVPGRRRPLERASSGSG